MTALDAAPPAKGGETSDDELSGGVDAADAEGGALSLESLQEEESRDELQSDDYGDGDE
jgi:hypothetical protein